MKRILKIAALACIVMLGSSLRNDVAAQYDDYDDGYYGQDRQVDYQTFYDELSPHGRWVDYPGHGYVWVPNAGNDFRPYGTNGRWVWTDNYEWMWVSDYDWGWAPFHYGRWDYDDYYGWYWVPGYEWSPAWVAWRDGGDYYGWAPIRPGISISVNFNIGGYAPPVNFWCFTPRRYILSPRIYDHCLDYRRNVTIIHQTNIIVNNYRYGGGYGFRSGPRRYDAEVYVGRINPVRFRQSYTAGRNSFRNNEVSVYRPSFRQNSNRQVAPRSFERYDRNNGSFRNRSDNNADIRNRDNAINNRPGRAENNDRGFRRNDDNTVRQRNDNNLPQPDRNRRFERNDNNNAGQPREDRRVFQPSERPVRERQVNPGNNDNGRFERRPDERRVENPGRQPEVRGNDNRRFERQQPQMERRVERPQQQPQMERRQEQRQPQMERRQEQRQPQMERRQEQRQPQMERRQEQPREQRSFERRSDNGGGAQRQGGNGGGGNGNGRRGRF